jgi:hypothetical protein
VNATGYTLTYRRGPARARVTVSEVFVCAECADSVDAYCGCFAAARRRAKALCMAHEIHRGGRLVAFNRSDSTDDVDAAPCGRAA